MATIVMTGGSSGFGAVAVRRLTERPGVRLLLGARSVITDSAGAVTPIEVFPLDLTRLESVRHFAATIHEELGGDRLDGLLMNAGTVRADDAGRTVDGFETTFAVNHLAHYLLIRLLMLDLAAGARVVMTTSGTHDPATRASLAVPRHADANLLARPDRDPGRHARARQAGQHAYTASRLCTVLTVRALDARADIRAGQVSVVAYDPGQVFGTGLARDLALPLRVAWRLLGTPLGAPLRRFNPEQNTRPAAGHALADLASGTTVPPKGRTYAALRHGRLTWQEPSELARSDDLARALWVDSARLVGLRA